MWEKTSRARSIRLRLVIIRPVSTVAEAASTVLRGLRRRRGASRRQPDESWCAGSIDCRRATASGREHAGPDHSRPNADLATSTTTLLGAGLPSMMISTVRAERSRCHHSGTTRDFRSPGGP